MVIHEVDGVEVVVTTSRSRKSPYRNTIEIHAPSKFDGPRYTEWYCRNRKELEKLKDKK